MTLYDGTRSAGAGRALPLALAVSLALALSRTGAARADQEALVPREYRDLGCRVQLPARWTEQAPAAGAPAVRFRREGRALRAELRAISPRRDLDDVARRVAAAARESGLATHEAQRRFLVDGREAVRLSFEGERGGARVRQLVFAIDAPARTYLLLVGDRSEEIDVLAADRVAESLEPLAAAESPAPPPPAPPPPAPHHSAEEIDISDAPSEPAPSPAEPAPSPGPPPTPTPSPAPAPAPAPPPTPTAAPSRWGCPSCGKEWPSTQKFCGECGAKCGPL
jgi:hypothetical protein